MELKEETRQGNTRRIRREGKIPAVVYTKGAKEGRSIAIDRAEFEAHIRKIKKGGLATVVFQLNGKRAIIKEIQYHPVTYQVLHIDFFELQKGERVNVNVPIRYTGEADCVGIKLGGVLRPVIRALAVNCPTDAIPEEFTLDVRELQIGGTKRLSDLVIPEGVKPQGRVKMEEVAVVIGKG